MSIIIIILKSSENILIKYLRKSLLKMKKVSVTILSIK